MITFDFRESKKIFSLFLFFMILSFTFSYAQNIESSYEMYPKMKSYLNQPETMLDQNLEGLSIPQVTEGTENAAQKNDMLPDEKLLERSTEAVKSILFDKKINPKEYILGPTDIIGVYLWGELDKDYRLIVRPEGNLIIPTVGSVQVADISLEDAKDLIKKAVSRKYKDIDVSIYLIEPRWFNVYVSGVVYLPGAQEANSLSRVSDIYNKSRPIKRPSTLSTAGKRGSSFRHIYIKRNDKIIPVDLLKFEKIGDLKANPYIMNGDQIMIPEYFGDISILGEVNNFGIYEFKEGDRVKDLVAFGGGLTTLSDSTEANLIRFKEDGYNLDYRKINLIDALINNPDDPQYLLSEGDRLVVPTKNDYKRYTSVVITGAVKYPAQYGIVHHITKLSELIDMAGGLTPYANLEDARVLRPVTTTTSRTNTATNTNINMRDVAVSSTSDMEYERLMKIPVSEMTDDEYEYFKQRSRTTQGLINVDFVKLIEKGDKNEDVLLEPGDNIYIPLKKNMVEVIGAVKKPGNISIESGKDYIHYLSRVGGLSWNADEDKIRIVKGKTGQRFKAKRNRDLEPGDTIFVPEKKSKDYWMLFKDTTLIFANVATAVIVAKNIIK